MKLFNMGHDTVCEHLHKFLKNVSNLPPDYMASHPKCSMMTMTMMIMIMRTVTVDGHNRNPISSAWVFSCTIPNCHFFFHWNYIPGWSLTSSKSFHHSPLDCAFILQFLHPIRIMSPLTRYTTSPLVYLFFYLNLLLVLYKGHSSQNHSLPTSSHVQPIRLPTSLNFVSYSS